ncbi:hypothetical protein RFI_29097 [Reticulomyxa filosa]|uniref:Uncharacterized protein n=1 Tax=Reticulomyxa filosa TaxID=46433 RepID=X6M2X8_RETFI|nr:hypothetical protein RFI_29097 [Reticulomyxa filosa]|eukprot:ETO08294.1 hypothetical protein RFI_29097 [Reticulomyxa filosa]
MFGRLFGSSNASSQKPPPTDLNSSIQKLRQAIQTLEKREEHLEKKIKDCVENAKKKSKNRDKKGDDCSFCLYFFVSPVSFQKKGFEIGPIFERNNALT